MDKLPKGITFYLENCIPIDDLREILLKITRFIQDKEPFSKLDKYDDWWQHDGLHFEKGKIEVGYLFEILGSNRSLYEATPRDDYVRLGISNKEKSWYLRFFVDWDEEEKYLEGDFHFSVPDEWKEVCKKELFNNCDIKINEEDSQKVSLLLIE